MTPERIREIRTRLEMTQTEFGKRLGVSLSVVQRWEAGDREPTGPAVLLLDQLADQAARRKPPKKPERRGRPRKK